MREAMQVLVMDGTRAAGIRRKAPQAQILRPPIAGWTVAADHHSRRSGGQSIDDLGVTPWQALSGGMKLPCRDCLESPFFSQDDPCDIPWRRKTREQSERIGRGAPMSAYDSAWRGFLLLMHDLPLRLHA